MEPRLAKLGLVSTWSYRDLPEIIEVAPHDSLQILRILQEALANVFKHANARQVWVDVCFKEGVLELRVRDDGEGYDSTRHQPGRGLANMLMRAARIGADLSITPSSKGTVVLLRFHLSAATHAAT
jgi:signal transduction histidine kinase